MRDGGRRERRALSVFLSLVAFSLAGSGLSRLAHLDPGPIAPVASLLTLGAGVVATFGAYVRTVPGAWARLLGALAFGAGAEVVGLATGFPFGRYAYTGAWWPSVALPIGSFPLALPFAWLLMAGAATLSVPRVTYFPLMGGLLAATVDLAMEPVMAGPLDYWRWLRPGPLPGGAPIANLVGWWATACLAGLILAFRIPPVPLRTPRRVLLGFLALILGLGLIGRPLA